MLATWCSGEAAESGISRVIVDANNSHLVSRNLQGNGNYIACFESAAFAMFETKGTHVSSHVLWPKSRDQGCAGSASPLTGTRVFLKRSINRNTARSNHTKPGRT